MINPSPNYSFPKIFFSLSNQVMTSAGNVYSFLKNFPQHLFSLTQRINQKAEENFNQLPPSSPKSFHPSQSITSIKPSPFVRGTLASQQKEKTTKTTIHAIADRTLQGRPWQRKQQIIETFFQPSIITPPKITKNIPPSSCNRTLIDVPGDGNCQLHAILKGLEIQYPHLLEAHITHQSLRQIGINFIETCLLDDNPLSEECYGYLDSDRKEYNSDLKRRAFDFLKSDLLKIEQALTSTRNQNIKSNTAIPAFSKLQATLWIKQIATKQGKIRYTFTEAENKILQQLNLTPKRQVQLESTYTPLINRAYEAYEKLSKRLDEEVLIQTNEEFLKRCSQNYFWCSSLHLFALSAFFGIPIAVHDPLVPTGFGAQTFNPTNSESPSIQLYRFGGNHYQYVLTTT